MTTDEIIKALRHIGIIALTCTDAEQKLLIIRDYCEKLIRQIAGDDARK